MQTLQRLLATTVVEALEKREHVIVAPGRTDALADEVEGIIAPNLATITANLEPERQVLGEVTSTFGHEAADEAVETAVDEIAERLMQSDHVDDIFAEDRLIRRDAFRAIQGVLLRYVRGELEVQDEDSEAESTDIELDRLGYLVSTVAQRADPSLLESTLERAAAATGVKLVRLDAADRRATFSPGPSGSDVRLSLEEAITERLVDLVDADLVELPTMERVLKMPPTAARHADFARALQGAARLTQQLTGCAAACTVVDAETLLASLTPLSEDGARQIDTHFDTFLENLESSIALLITAPSNEQSASSRPRKRSSAGSRNASSGRAASKTGARRASKPPSSRTPSKPPSSRRPASKRASTPSSSRSPSKPPSSRKPASKRKNSTRPKPIGRQEATAAAKKNASQGKPPSSRRPRATAKKTAKKRAAKR